MKLTRIIAATAAALLPLVASAATFIIPAAGSGPGANGSQWKTELKIHVTGLEPVTVGLRFHRGTAVFDGGTIRIDGSTTRTLDDVVARELQTSGSGAIEVFTEREKDFRRLAVTSRTYNQLPNGDQLAQDVPAVPLADAAVQGDFVILSGPSHANRQRFNFGIYAAKATRVTWDLLRGDGQAVASKSVSYAAAQHVQYNNGIQTLFGQTLQDSDTVRAIIDNGEAFLYGSAIDSSGDPSYAQGVRTREQFDLVFLGIDIDEDGTIDIADANNDGVLDRPLDIITSLFPATIRVIAETELGTRVASGLELLSSTTDAQFNDRNGTLMIGAPGDFKGKTGEVRIRARSDSSIETFVIPIRFL